MLKERKRSFVILFRFVEIIFLLLSFKISYALIFGWNLAIDEIPLWYIVIFSINLLGWVYLSDRFDLYGSKRLTSFRYEALDIAKATVFSVLAAVLPMFLMHGYSLNKLLMLGLWLIQTGFLISVRLLVRQTLKFIRRYGYDERRVLIVGRNDRALKIAKKIEEAPEYGFINLGFIDGTENTKEANWPRDTELIGDVRDLESILREKVVDAILVTLPLKSHYSKIEEIISLCEKVGVEVEIPIDLFPLKSAKAEMSKYDGEVSLINLYTAPKIGWQLAIKRFIDIFISSVLLFLLFPIFVITGILIKVTSKGPIVFKQQRIGYNGRRFNCLKFRTMVDNAEKLKKDLMHLNEMEGPVFKIRDDPRATKIGRVLRKTSIDELPQLINVLKGDMSLVGPRPPVPHEVSEYDLKDRRRLSMKPGITCIWQISGRNSIPFEKWMEMDMKYIDQWSLWLDFTILAKTLPAVFLRKGAQ